MRDVLQKLFITMACLLCNIVIYAHTFEKDGIYYSIYNSEEKTVTVTYRGNSDGEYDNEYSGIVRIPENVTYDATTYRVVRVSSAFLNCTGLEKVILPNSVTMVGQNSFSGCTNLEYVSMSNSVISIDKKAFYNCPALTSISLPNTLTSIGESAFSGCTSLTTIDIPENVSAIGASAFYGCTSLNSITVGNSVSTIGASAFYGCTSLNSITIGNSVSTIGASAFYNCAALTELTIPKSVTSVGGDAFTGCVGLKKLILTDGNSSLRFGNNQSEYGLFNDCPIETLYLGRNVTCSVNSNIAKSFQGIEQLKTLVIGDSVTVIFQKMFRDCTGLTTLTIPGNVSSIGVSAFDGCTGIKELVIADSDSTLTLIDEVGTHNGLFTECPLEKLYVGRNLSYSTKETAGFSPFYAIEELKTITIGDKVTAIPGFFLYNCNSFSDIIIPDNIVTIGSYAFYGCTALTSITIPNSVTTIGKQAFGNCTGLEITTIGGGVTLIGSSAFFNCTAMKNLIMSDGENDLTFDGEIFSKVPIETLYLGRNLVYEDRPFSGRTDLKTVTIGDKVTALGDSFFYGCSGLTELTLGSGLATIGSRTFYNCAVLEEVVMPNSVNSVGTYAFYGCTGLTKVTLSDNLTSLSDYLFYGCTGLAEIVIPKSLTTIGTSVFYGCTALKEFIMPNGINSVGSSAFYGCTGLTKVTLSDNLTALSNKLFCNCSGLPEFVIPKSVATIGSDAFYGCTGIKKLTIADSETPLQLAATISSWTLDTLYLGRDLSYNYTTSPFSHSSQTLKSVTISNNVTTLGNNMFENCTGLTEVVIPNSVDSIGEKTFYGCTGLQKVNIPENVTSLNDYVFGGCSSLTEIVIPSSVTTIGNYAFNSCSGIKKLTIADSETPLQIGANNSSWALDTLYLGRDLSYSYSPFSSRKTLKSVTMSNNVTTLGNNMFENCTGLTEVVIPNSVDSIGEKTFYGCTGLQKVNIPENVTSLNDYVFGGCSSLTEIVIPKSVTNIGVRAFYNCSRLPELVISSSVTTIGNYAFNGCSGIKKLTIADSETSLQIGANNSSWALDTLYLGRDLSYSYSPFSSRKTLKSVTMSNNVTTLGNNMFENCTGLTEVVIPNSVDSIGEKTFYGCTGITALTIGGNVADIAALAFYSCNNIKSVYAYPEVTPTIQSSTFSCESKATLHVVKGCETLYSEHEFWSEFFQIVGDLRSLNYVVPERVELDKEEVFAVVTDTIILSATLYPENATEKEVVWSVENDELVDIVAIDALSVKVIAQKEGETTVTATSVDGSNLTATCRIVIEPTPVCGIALDTTSVDLLVAEIITLSVTITPETATVKDVEWTSSDETVATVENGVVTAHNVGLATITATTTDGTNLSASCEVTVNAIPVESIVLDKNAITIKTSETITLSATIMPENATIHDVVWSTSDESVATVDAGFVTALGVGKATITATTTDGTNLSASCEVTVEPVLAEYIEFDKTSVDVAVGDTIMLVVTIYPENVTEKAALWTISDPTAVEIEMLSNLCAQIVVLKDGAVTIEASTIDGTDLTTTCLFNAVYTGLDDVITDDVDVEYYDLQGLRVTHPTKGIYIVRQGEKVKKVVL